MKNYHSTKMDKFTNTPTEIDTYVEILSKQLYFAVLKGKHSVKLKNNMDTFFFTTDDELLYENYYSDFGPLNIACVYKYCCKLNKYLKYAKGLKSVVYYTCSNPDKKANAACLIGCYCVIYLNLHPRETWKILQELGPYKPYLDASQCPCGFSLKILDCLQAINKASTFNFFNFDDFNVTEYDLYDKLQYGDVNWLVPRKFLAFIGPADNRTAHPPEFYIKYFLKNDVKTIIRLNTIIYDAAVFTQVGIEHIDLIFPDGTTPPKDILLKFLTIAELAPAAIAVHCKAGLGRTGSLIGAYLIKHYQMTAREAIAWMRLCRPGSVIGQQQIWLERIESWLWKSGSQYRLRKYGAADKIPRHRYGIYSKVWPLEREKIINEARKKIQITFTRSQFDKISKQKKATSASADSIGKFKHQRSLKRTTPTEPNFYKSVSKLLSSVHTNEQPEIGANAARLLKPNLIYPSLEFYRNDPGAIYGAKAARVFQNREQSNKNKSNQQKHVTTSTSQGDKLNEIKASWINSNVTTRNIFCRSTDNDRFAARENRYNYTPNY